ncbi:TolC family protein [Myroides sp. LJL119]
MIHQWIKSFLVIFCSLIATQVITAQQSQEKILSIEELFNLVQQNHPALKVSRSDIEISNENLEISKNQLLPEISLSIQAYYNGDTNIIDKDFSNSTNVHMPDFGNKYAIQAKQMIWKGGAIRNGIQIQNLKKELSELNYQTNQQSIKLLTLSYFLDLYKLYNQELVYNKNIELAQQRLDNIHRFFDQGLVTSNDVIRAKLQLSNLQLALQVIQNNQHILNRQLTMALGLQEETVIKPDPNIKQNLIHISDLQTYLNQAKQHPGLKSTQTAVEITKVAQKTSKSEMLPSLSAFAGNSLQRPITTTSPALDMYAHGWSAGLSLNFSIDALFKAPKKIRLNKAEQEKAINQESQAMQMIDTSIYAAYIMYQQAISQNSTLKVNKDLSQENYRIMLSKYDNQLAILLDLIDASNTQLDSELQYANSEIDIVFSYYKLLKEAGTL